jgi:hypothetical protein
MLIALPAQHWSHWSETTPALIASKLIELAARVDPVRVRTRKRGPKINKPTAYVDGETARSHHSTARLLKRAQHKES